MSIKTYQNDQNEKNYLASLGFVFDDHIYHENESTFTRASFGAISKAHGLIMPKLFPYSNFGSSDDLTFKDSELAKTYLRTLVGDDEQAFFYEHGATNVFNAGSCRGSCGGLAHIHFLILNKDVSLTPEILDRYIIKNDFVKSDPEQFDREKLYQYTADGGAYISYELDDGTSYYYPVENLPSQFMQRTMTSIIQPKKKFLKWQESMHTKEGRELYKQNVLDFGMGRYEK